LQNCVVWGNSPDQLEDRTPSALMTVTYSDVQDGTGELWFGTGCIDADPQFAGGPSGTWTSDGTYDEPNAQTTFTDTNANWTDNELAGKFLRPNLEYEPADPNDPNEPSAYFQSLIVDNTATSVTVWGDFAHLGTAGASYQVNDYHISPGSPCIDAGDNEAVPDGVDEDFDGNPRFVDDPCTDDTGNGTPPIVDMGPYEYQPCAGDVDCDGDTGHSDLGLLLAAWCTHEGDPNWNPDADLDGDGHVGHGDLGILLADWGCGT
jgi:hypothetical protein